MSSALVALSFVAGIWSDLESTTSAGGELLLEKRGLSLLIKKSSLEEISTKWVLEKALTLLDLRGGAFVLVLVDVFDKSLSDEIVFAVEDVEEFSKVPLLDEDLNAETAIVLETDERRNKMDLICSGKFVFYVIWTGFGKRWVCDKREETDSF